MQRRNLYNFSWHPFLIWGEVTFKTAEMMVASALVIGHRANMAWAGPSASVSAQRELALMGSEKISATAESVQAMAFSLVRLNQQLGVLAFKQLLTGASATLSLASSRTPAQSAAQQARLVRDTIANSALATPQISTSVARLVQRGLKPIHSRATSNAKRLSRR